jgi:hypothetical protein
MMTTEITIQVKDPVYAEPLMEAETIQFAEHYGSIDLSTYETDRPQRIRIFSDREGNLSVDSAQAYWLVAEIDIPPRQYELAQEAIEGKEPEESTPPERMPITADALAIKLWPLPVTNEKGGA